MRFTAFLFSLSLPLNALTIQIDYSLDSNGFFNASGNPRGETGANQARAALEAAAARWSIIINQTLPEVFAPDHPTTDVRLSFPDPSNFTGGNPGNPGSNFEVYEIGSAQSSGTDSLVWPALRPPASHYENGINIPEDTFIIYVGGRALIDDALTGAFIGHNHVSVAEDEDSILNRGFNNGLESLPAWGSSISFNSLEDSNNNPVILERKWHFDHTSPVPADAKDFYSVALREIGHALGIGLFYNDWTRWISGSEFIGPNSRAAYLNEYGSQTSSLNMQGPDNRYFSRGAYESTIFSAGNPNLVDTVGLGVPQALLFQARRTSQPGVPPAQFIPGIIHGVRYEVTNIDVAAIRDLGWRTIAPAPENDVAFVNLDRNPVSGTVTLTFPSEVGETYTIQTSPDMSTWNNVSPVLPSEGTTTDWSDGEAGYLDPTGSSFLRNRKYYRVIKND